MPKLFSFRTKLISVISVLYFVCFFALYNLDSLWENGDSAGYYMHTVSFLLYNDVGLYDKSTKAMIASNPSTKHLLDDPFWMRETDIGKKYIKYTIGVAVMEVPGFLLGHLYSYLDQNYKSDGWSKPYIVAVNISKVIYVLLAFYFLIGVLLSLYEPRIVALTTIGIAFGTNLFFHIPNLTIAHPFLFFDFCMLIYFTHQFYLKPNYNRAIMIGLFVGLISITRVPEIIAFVIPVFWGVFNKKTFIDRVTFLKKNLSYLAVSIVVFAILCLPQLAYWHYVSGQWFFNPYDGEGFNFLKPKFEKALFSFDNGWLTYTPLMFLALLGLPTMRKKALNILLPIVLFVGLNSWIHFSYYTVNYFPGLGSRPMIESYPLLAFPLASFFVLASKTKLSNVFSIVILTCCIALNIFQTIQSQRGILFSENMNPTYYREIFGKLKIDANSVKEFDSNEDQPDENDLQFVSNLYTDGFERKFDPPISQESAYAGKNSFLSEEELPKMGYGGTLGDNNLSPGEYLSVSIQVYRRSEDFVHSLYDLEQMRVEFTDPDGRIRKGRSLKMARYTNESASIFNLGSTDTWGYAQFFVQVPHDANDNWTFNVFIKNPAKKKLFLDDFRIDKYVSKK